MKGVKSIEESFWRVAVYHFDCAAKTCLFESFLLSNTLSLPHSFLSIPNRATAWLYLCLSFLWGLLQRWICMFFFWLFVSYFFFLTHEMTCHTCRITGQDDAIKAQSSRIEELELVITNNAKQLVSHRQPCCITSMCTCTHTCVGHFFFLVWMHARIVMLSCNASVLLLLCLMNFRTCWLMMRYVGWWCGMLVDGVVCWLMVDGVV